MCSAFAFLLLRLRVFLVRQILASRLHVAGILMLITFDASADRADQVLRNTCTLTRASVSRKESQILRSALPNTFSH